MSNDAQKLQDAMMAIHAIWGAPCYVVAILILLWFQARALFASLLCTIVWKTLLNQDMFECPCPNRFPSVQTNLRSMSAKDNIWKFGSVMCSSFVLVYLICWALPSS